MAGTQPPREVADDGLRARAEARARHTRRPVGARQRPAARAAQGVAAVLRHLDPHGRHLADLAALRLWVSTSQLATAAGAGRRLEFDQVIDLFGRQQPASATLMAGLAAALPALGLARRLRLIRGRVGRWWLG